MCRRNAIINIFLSTRILRLRMMFRPMCPSRLRMFHIRLRRLLVLVVLCVCFVFVLVL